MKKIGVIGIKNAWSTDRLLESIQQRVGQSFLIEMEKVHFDSYKNTVFYENMDLSKFDAFIIKKISGEYSPDNYNKLDILRYLKEKHKIRIFSDPSRIMQLLNRIGCTITLQANNLPMPQTFITEDISEACKTVKKFKKAVLKPLYSTKAKGMKVINEKSNISKSVEEFVAEGNRTIYIQKMLDLADRDYGVVFIGEKYLATYARLRSNSSWNTTTYSGGKYVKHEPSRQVLDIATRARELFDLDFTSVDIAETNEGIFLFEVSAFGAFRGLMEANNIDAADLYIEYVLKEIG